MSFWCLHLNNVRRVFDKKIAKNCYPRGGSSKIHMVGGGGLKMVKTTSTWFMDAALNTGFIKNLLSHLLSNFFRCHLKINVYFWFLKVRNAAKI